MKLYKSGDRAIICHEGLYYETREFDWDVNLGKTNLCRSIIHTLKDWDRYDLNLHERLNPPMGSQEIWAAGVTYMRSKVARMEESEEAGGGDFYDKVYDAERPELFLKATASRAVGNGENLFIRPDSEWNVPEPELTLLISSEGTIEGYTVGNDMSSRSIEGQNPLYLPQAKMYDRSAGLGPCILLTEEPIDQDTEISMVIKRNNIPIYSEAIPINQIKRPLDELVDYLFRCNTFPNGCFLMTGTGIVPPDDFTLFSGDVVHISIQGIGTLTNIIEHYHK